MSGMNTTTPLGSPPLCGRETYVGSPARVISDPAGVPAWTWPVKQSGHDIARLGSCEEWAIQSDGWRWRDERLSIYLVRFDVELGAALLSTSFSIVVQAHMRVPGLCGVETLRPDLTRFRDGPFLFRIIIGCILDCMNPRIYDSTPDRRSGFKGFLRLSLITYGAGRNSNLIYDAFSTIAWQGEGVYNMHWLLCMLERTDEDIFEPLFRRYN